MKIIWPGVNSSRAVSGIVLPNTGNLDEGLKYLSVNRQASENTNLTAKKNHYGFQYWQVDIGAEKYRNVFLFQEKRMERLECGPQALQRRIITTPQRVILLVWAALNWNFWSQFSHHTGKTTKIKKAAVPALWLWLALFANSGTTKRPKIHTDWEGYRSGDQEVEFVTLRKVNSCGSNLLSRRFTPEMNVSLS